MPPQPWYHEQPGPELFNSWTWTHFAWGMASARAGVGFLNAFLLHTGYEMVEGFIFPWEDRDVSMRNHVGDTVAFLAGWAVLGAIGGRR